MKLSILSLLLTTVVTCAFGQWGDNYIKLSENITTESKNMTGFDKIDVSEDFEVYIHYSEGAEKVEIEANENLHDLIVVEKNGETLMIYTKPYSMSSGTVWGGAPEKLVANITVNKLSEIRGDEDVIFVLEDKIYADKLTIDLNEDSELEGHLEVRELVVRLDEDSVLDVRGSAETMDVQANEDSTLKGMRFVTRDLSIELDEDSMAKLTVNGKINLRAREDSYFYFRGDGYFAKKRLTGDSEIKNW